MHKLIQNCKIVRFLLSRHQNLVLIASKLVSIIEIKWSFLKPFLTWQHEIANIPVPYLMKNYYAIIAILYDGYIINRVYRIISSPILPYFFQIILSKKKKDNGIISYASMKLKTIIPLDNQTQQSQPFQWILNTKSTFQMYYESAAKSLTHCFVKRSSAVEGAKMKS